MVPRGPKSDEITAPLDLTDPRFAVGGVVGRGGMSVIYAATDVQRGGKIAIKACRKRDAAAWMRLQRETSVLAVLDHPRILPIYASGITPSGAPWLATRLVEGTTLEQKLKADPKSWPKLLPHVVDVADAIAHAHGRGIVHRDLKPGNVLVDQQGHTVIIDWGLAREMGAAEPDAPPARPSAQITLPGAAVGTPGYWAPEQRAEGDVVDPRSDVYSLGATLFRMIAGHPGYPVVPLGADLEKELAPAPPALRALVARATAISPSARHPTMAQFAEELRNLVPGRRRGVPPLLVAVVVLLALASIGLLIYLLP